MLEHTHSSADTCILEVPYPVLRTFSTFASSVRRLFLRKGVRQRYGSTIGDNSTVYFYTIIFKHLQLCTTATQLESDMLI